MPAAAHLPPASDYAALDEALQILAAYGPDLRNGMTSHAPMAAEALCAIGRPDAVRPWVERYRAGMLPWPPPVAPIAPAAWRAALGQERRSSDWRDLFTGALRDAPWRDVLDRWVDRLAPGLCAAATHGVIRVAHAARALAAGDTRWRRQELADALASWAATYQELPTQRGAVASHASPLAALAQVAIVPLPQRRFTGTITGSLAALSEWPAFAPVIDLLALGEDAAAQVDALRDAFARLYLANAHDVLTSIVFIHGVTAVSAVGSMLPLLTATTARRALCYAWQAGCGLYAAFGTRPPLDAVAAPQHDATQLLDCAVAHGDEHAIKFAAACLGMGGIPASPVARAAVQHALAMLPRAQ